MQELMPKFDLGMRIVLTQGTQRLNERGDLNLMDLLKRHGQLEPGNLDKEDQASNRRAVKDGSRIMSSYDTPVGVVWVITEAVGEVTDGDGEYYRAGRRAATTFLLPSEY
jgi:hypothetical protein